MLHRANSSRGNSGGNEGVGRMGSVPPLIRAALIAAFMAGWLTCAPVSRAENLLGIDWSWATAELDRMDAALDDVQRAERRFTTDADKHTLFFDFYNTVVDMQVADDTGYLDIVDTIGLWCVDNHSYANGTQYAFCQYQYMKVDYEIRVAYELMEQYALWMSHWYAIREALSLRNSDIIHDQRAGIPLSRVRKIIQNQRDYIRTFS
jgi:hypothetical protein